MVYVTPATKTAGDGLTAADWNAYVRDNQEMLHVPPRCLVDHDAVQSIPHATVTSVLFNSEVLDNDSMHSTTSDTSRITAKTAGLYTMAASVEFVANATGERVLSIVLNGSETLVTQAIDAPADPARINVATIYYMDVDDYVEARVYQTSTGALNLNTSSDIPNFRVAWIGG